MKYTINSIDFQTISQIKKYYQTMMKNYLITMDNDDMEGILIYKDDENYNFLIDLLKYNLEKKQTQIDYFEITKNKINTNSYHVEIYYNNNYHEDVSFIYCIKCIKKKPKYNWREKFRQTISSTVIEFKKNNILICEICKKNNLPYCDYHVDHVIKFRTLLKDFLENNPIHYLYVNHDEWKKYHDTNCKLRILCKDCNLLEI